MTDSKNLKLLLVEDDLENEQRLCQALIEIEENRQWCNWRSSSVVHVERLSDALDCLRRDWFDVVLLNLSLPDCPSLLDSFLDTATSARGAPILVLADQEDENLANLLLRDGAQDVLLKAELEGNSLARALRYAVERQRRTTALLSSPFLDDLTGALTRQGFLTIADYYVQLSRHHHKTLLMASLDIDGVRRTTQDERDAGELLLIRAADALRGVFDPPSLVGRVGICRFGLIATELTETTAEALLNRVGADIEGAAARSTQPPATVRFAIAQLDCETSPEDLLGENGEEFAARTHRHTKTVMLAD